MASGLLIKQKQLLAGDGITIEHAQTSSTISLSNSTLNAAVRIYDATIASDTGVVTITDGTPVADLNIGDEIRTPDGVYQKVKDGITTGSIPDDGSHILVSGCTDPTAVNGMYVATGEPNTWKNETGNYWISKLDGYGGPWWFIASSQAPANPGASSIHYRAIAATAQNPWDANFTPSHASGTISVQKYSDLVSKTDTIDLFEYASTSVASADIVQSVNGNKPDASGNVTIETGGSVDESRLLPENAANNELAIKKVGDTGIDTNTFLMLHFDEESGTPVDSSQSSLVINAGDTAVYSNGKFSRARNLNNSYLSTTCSAMATGTGDFTYDGWFYLTSTNKRRGLFASGSNCICFAAWEDNKFALGLSSTGNGWTYDHFDNDRFDFTFSANAWYHIAVVRNGNTLTVYINGNSISSFDVSNLNVPAVSGTDAFKIGYPLGGMSNSTDIVDEFRFSNVARWTENFTPPNHAYTSASEYWESITPDDLTSLMDANKFVPALSSQDIGKFLSVAGSQVQEGNDENTFLLLHFDGNTNDSSDNARSDISAAGVSYAPGKFNQAAQFTGSTSSYVTIPNTPEFPFSGDFTISFWAKASASDRFGLLFYESDFTFGIDTISSVYSVWASSNGASWDILQADSGYNSELTGDSGRGSIAITPGEWQHIAFVRSGNDWYLFVNGTMSLHKQRSGTVYNPQEQLRIGRHGNDDIRAFLGLIDEFKIDTIARWTEDFTPPEHAYDAYIAEGVHTEFTDINENIDAKIATHNQDSSAHPDKLPLSGGQMTGELKISASNALRLNNKDGYGVILRKDANKFYILATAQNDENGAYTESRPLEVNLATGGCDISGSALETESNLSSTGVYPSVSPNTTTTGDFNTYKTQGNYWFELGVRPNGPLGNDAETTGVLSVYNIKDTHTLQVYNLYRGTNVVTQQMYYRWYYNGTWSNWIKLSGSPILITNPDYNQVTQTGTYYMSTGSGSQNAPDQSSYMLTVLSYKETSWERIFQTAVRYVANTQSDKQAMFTRIGDRTTAGGEITWTKWSAISSSESIGTTTNDYNTLTDPGDYYLSFGDNSSNVNAPGNGPFHIMVHRYQNSAGTAKPILQIAASQIVSTAQTPMMFFRSASYANSVWTFQPWLRLLTEKDVTYNTGIAGGSLTKNDYIKIGNVIIYIGSVNLRLNSGTTFALPVLSNNMTFVASCNTYVSTITMLVIYLDSDNRLNIDIGGTRSESATDDQVNVGWIGIGYLS